LSNLQQQVHWTAPFTEQALFNVAPHGAAGGDSSDAVFHIRKPLIVTSPNGGETLTIGSQAQVKYSTQLPQVSGLGYMLQASYDGGTTWTNMSTNGNCGVQNGVACMSWTVVGPPATRTRLRVFYGSSTPGAYLPGSTTSITTSGPDAVPYDDSDADFIIALAPQ
jgi:hypothetical protein